MFGTRYITDNRKLSLYITIKCNGSKKFRAFAQDFGKKNSIYADREIEVNGERTIYFSFPVSPKEIAIGVYNVNEKADNSFSVVIEEKPLKTYNIWLDMETLRFVQFATNFSQLSGFSPASDKGRLFETNDKEFTIRYYNVITDTAGKPLNTPARIGHTSGIIDVSKVKFDPYTVAMRMGILLHEYSHKYKNPKMGLEISNEIGADINALYIYLGLGWSKVDIITVFAKVFLKAQTEGNIKRMRKIMEYIEKFENQEFAKLN